MTTKRTKNAAQRRLERVRAAFNADDLIRVCQMDESEFVAYATRFDLPASNNWRGQPLESYYFYQDNGAPILFVAHLDSVQSDRTTFVTDTIDGPLVTSGALDDRLGAYVGLELFPKLGIKADILLTTNEEMGSSSARHFYPDHKQYNWMIEFDRGGMDVVMYQYETDALHDMVEGVNAHVGIGSYSDIADLDHLGCAGFNWGVGYHDYHSKRSHAWLDDTFRMVGKFMRFNAAYATTLFEYEPLPYQSRYAWMYPQDDEEIAVVVDGVEYDLCPGCLEVDLDAEGCCWECGYGVIHKNIARKEA